MAVQRLTHRFATGLGILGLGLTIATGVFLRLPKIDRGDAPQTNARLDAWTSAQLYQITNAFEQMFQSRPPHLARGKAGAAPNSQATASIDPAAALGYDIAGLREALPFYKAGDLADGDEQALAATDPVVRTTLEWVALRSARDLTYDRLQTFLVAHPNWPARDFIMRRTEEAIYTSHIDAPRIEALFAKSPPETVLGKLALARALQTDGNTAGAQSLARAVWRRAALGPILEAKVRTEFGADLTAADDKARADRLLYEGDDEAGLRAAAHAGNAVLALARLRVAVNNEVATDKMFAAVPTAMQSDPAFLFAKIQKLRRADKIKEAAALMLTAPHDPDLVVDGDAWWDERRILARKLLDLDDPATAYLICAGHTAEGKEAKIDAEFLAGWIALRFLNDPVRAAKHFDVAARFAETPISIARIAYWRGRTAEISLRDDAGALAKAYYEKAAALVGTYYGQLARERLGLRTIPLRRIASAATGQARDQSVKVVELLYALDERDLALGLATAAAQHLTSEAQLAALANVVAAQHDAHASLVIGKILAQRQVPIDSLAYPTYGVPPFDPAANSATPAVVYAIARQESAFDPHAVSSAGAKGLMQMIVSTAKRTAERVGVDFDAARLLSDPAFNAKLGAAHLGELFAEQKGSPILAFAAYNAGGRRVKEWIEAHGDPRSPGVDPVDWVERIPFEETRNYVQRVMENWTMYRVSFAAANAARQPAKSAKIDTAVRVAAKL